MASTSFKSLDLLRDSAGAGVSVAGSGKAEEISGATGTIHVFLDAGATAATVKIKVGNDLNSSGSTAGFVVIDTLTLDATGGKGVVFDGWDAYRYVSVDVDSVTGGKVRAVMNRSY